MYRYMYLLSGSFIGERKCSLNTNTPIISYIIIDATRYRYAAYKRMWI